MYKAGVMMMNMECMERGMCLCCCIMPCFHAFQLHKGRIKSE